LAKTVIKGVYPRCFVFIFPKKGFEMLIVALLGALVFYTVLYIIWSSSQTHLDSVAAWMRLFNQMALMPETQIFQILRGLILIVALYVLADFLLSGARGLKRRVKKSRQAKEPFAISYKKPPQI